MDIKLLSSEDAKAYWELRLEALKENPEAFGSSYEEAIERVDPIKKVAKNLDETSNFTYGAFRNHELIGMITLLLESGLKIKHKANLFAFYVTPSERGLKIGKSLLLTAIQKAREIEVIEQLQLTVVTGNLGAIELYRSQGFHVYGTEVQALKHKNMYYDEHYMVLKL